jgi:hypothetical protein
MTTKNQEPSEDITNEEDVTLIIKHYHEELMRDLFIDNFRMGEMTRKVGLVRGKWYGRYSTNRGELFKKERYKIFLETQGVQKLFEHYQDQGHPMSEVGVKAELKKGDKYRETLESIERLTFLCEYFKGCCENMDKLSFDIKHVLENTKFEEM